MAPPRNVLFITVDQWRGDCLSALGHPVLETPALEPWPAAVCCSPITGPTPRRAAPPGPASTPAPTSIAIGPCRTAPHSIPASPTSRSWPGSWAMTLCSSATPTQRPTLGRCHRVIPGSPPTKAILPGFRSVLHDPWEEGSPGWGTWLAGQGFDVPGNPHALYEPIDGIPRIRRARRHVGAGPVPGRALPDDASWARPSRIGWRSTVTGRSSSTPRSSVPIRLGATRSGTTTSTTPNRSGPSRGASRPRGRGGHPPLRRHGARRAPT